MAAFLFGRMFFWDLLLIGLVLTYRLPHRSHYWPRVAFAAAACTAISCLWTAVFDAPANTYMVWMIADYFGASLIVMAAIWFCVRLKGWVLFYFWASIWFVQNAAHCAEMLLFRRTDMTLCAFALHGLVTLLFTLAVYFASIRRIEFYILERIKLQMVAPVWAAMCIVCLFMNSYASLHGEASASYYMAALVCNLVGLFYQDNLYRVAGLERENESVEALLQQSKKQYQLSKINMEQLNIKCHDLRHQIRHYRRSGGIDKAVLSEMEQAVNNYDMTIKTGNPALDVLLTEKNTLCSHRHIGFTCMAEAAGLNYIEPADLYALFGNAMDNAIEATELLQDSEQRQIALTVRRIDGLYSINLQNYTTMPLVLENGLPLTSKSDKQSHGFGVRSMQLLVEKYGGELSYMQEENIVNLYMLLPAKN